jgi:putative endonuclease
MYYVYILQSINTPDHHYIGCTNNLKRRFKEHNSTAALESSKHQAKYAPWQLVNYFAFTSLSKARAFEIYLKTSAGRRFQKKHFG